MAKGKRDAESKKRETKGDKVTKKLKKVGKTNTKIVKKNDRETQDSINENTKRVSAKDIKSKKEKKTTRQRPLRENWSQGT